MVKQFFIFLVFTVLYQLGCAQVDYRQLRFTYYGVQNGLPQNHVTQINQDRLGYLWVGTSDGLARFNGYEFDKFYFEPSEENSIIGNNIVGVHLVDSLNMLFSSSLGLSNFNLNTKRFSNIYINQKGLGSVELSVVNPITKEILISTSKGVYFIAQKDTTNEIINFKWLQLHKMPAQQLIPFKEHYLMVSNKRLYHINSVSKTITPFKGSNLKVEFIQLLANDELISFEQGYLRLYDANKSKMLNQLFLSPNIQIRAVKRINEAYFVVSNQGLIIVSDFKEHHQAKIQWLKHNKLNQNGIANNELFDVFQDSFGMIWLATRSGLNKLDPNKQQFIWTRRSELMQDNSLSNNCLSFFEDEKYFISTYQDGILWKHKQSKLFYTIKTDFRVNAIAGKDDYYVLATNHGLKSIKVHHDSLFELLAVDERLTAINDSLLFDEVYDLSLAHNTLCIGAHNGIYLKKLQAKSFYHKDLGRIRAIAVDEKGGFWCGAYLTNLYRFTLSGADQWETAVYSFSQTNVVPPISLSVKDGEAWVGLWGGGLMMYNSKDSTTNYFSKKNGLVNNTILGVILFTEDEIWISTSNGLSMLNTKEKKFINYTIKDGLQSMEFNMGAFFKGENNYLYFGGLEGYHTVLPKKRLKNNTPPIVRLKGVYWEGGNLLDKTNLKESDKHGRFVTLPYHKSSVTFVVDGIHFGNPEENLFAYNLVGLSDEWIAYKNKREFYFANLSPGEYVFKIRVANSDGVWSKDVESITLIVAKPFWQRWWFILLCVLVVLAVFASFYITRISLVKQQKAKLEKMVSRRTREVEEQKTELERQKSLIEEEKRKEEKLLLNILPRETARELMNTGRAAPRSYRKATVMFADFKNFTRIAENLRPNELVAELDDCFASFDDIVGVYSVEKIKTSGDAYMCVGGVPLRNNTNPVDCVLAALDFQRYMEEKRKSRKGTDKPQWNLRIGMHTGELIAGVVGKKKFLYDVWGDTVNIAARMETTSDPDKVNISGATYEQIKAYFDCEYRGKLPVKNKGAIDMYYVHRIKPELSEDGKGIKPNKRFMELLKFNSYTEISYNRASKFLLTKLEKELPVNLYYHGVHHTKDVIKAAERIGKAEGLEEEELVLVKLAALIHDAGFLTKYQENEEEGAGIARVILPKYGFTDQQVEIIEGMIRATKIPQNPQNHLEEVMCDADLDYLGRSKEEFDKISANLCKELVEYGFLKSKEDWDPIQVKFLAQHQYFTQTAINERREFKLQRLEEIQKRLKFKQEGRAK